MASKVVTLNVTIICSVGHSGAPITCTIAYMYNDTQYRVRVARVER